MALKASLKIVLHANNTVVAESDDPILWQKILSAINNPKAGAPDVLEDGDELEEEKPLANKGRKGIAKFAAELGVDGKVVEGACGPEENSPFIHLDKHHFESLKKNSPPRGAKAIPPVTLAATLLVLWKEAAGLPSVHFDELQPVLSTLNIEGTNKKRSLENCEWLQLRGETVSINPAKTSQAIAIAKAYCLQKPIDGKNDG